jgi:hypothetical protein
MTCGAPTLRSSAGVNKAAALLAGTRTPAVSTYRARRASADGDDVQSFKTACFAAVPSRVVIPRKTAPYSGETRGAPPPQLQASAGVSCARTQTATQKTARTLRLIIDGRPSPTNRAVSELRIHHTRGIAGDYLSAREVAAHPILQVCPEFGFCHRPELFGL